MRYRKAEREAILSDLASMISKEMSVHYGEGIPAKEIITCVEETAVNWKPPKPKKAKKAKCPGCGGRFTVDPPVMIGVHSAPDGTTCGPENVK